uniref:Uncharacterized protein n=1 Tax=Avena sativa TaxID=4498 RepID=A0ACD5W9B2_AVESA
MATATPSLLAALLAGCIILAVPLAVAATDHVIGDSIWSIPTSNDHYRVWASNRTFYVDDNLVFRFDTGMYNVVQVGRGEYDRCEAEDPYRIFDTSPAVIHLDFADVRWFVSSIGNYCNLGVKIWIPAQKRSYLP